MMRFFPFLFLFVLLFGCSKDSSTAIPKVIFDLSSAKQMNMAEFVDSIFLIPLETNDSSLVKSVQSLNITERKIFIEERGNMIAFDRNGTFLYSTRHLQGDGPESYYSGLDFTSLPDGCLEVFDAVRMRLIKYNKDLQYISRYKLPRDILPVAGCWYVSEDYRLFVYKNELKLYSIKENRIINSIRTKEIPHFGFYTRNSLQTVGDDLFLSVRNQNGYYKLFCDSFKMELQRICEFCFGDENNFNALDLPEGETERFYIEFKRNNPRKAFVSDMYIDGSKQMCFFIYGGKSYFAFRDVNQEISQVYYNIPMTRKQFLPANLYKNKIFYYACEPQALEYVTDESLMSSADVAIMKNVRVDDNPIIVCYKLK